MTIFLVWNLLRASSEVVKHLTALESSTALWFRDNAVSDWTLPFERKYTFLKHSVQGFIVVKAPIFFRVIFYTFRELLPPLQLLSFIFQILSPHPIPILITPHHWRSGKEWKENEQKEGDAGGGRKSCSGKSVEFVTNCLVLSASQVVLGSRPPSGFRAGCLIV